MSDTGGVYLQGKGVIPFRLGVSGCMRKQRIIIGKNDISVLHESAVGIRKSAMVLRSNLFHRSQ